MPRAARKSKGKRIPKNLSLLEGKLPTWGLRGWVDRDRRGPCPDQTPPLMMELSFDGPSTPSGTARASPPSGSSGRVAANSSSRVNNQGSTSRLPGRTSGSTLSLASDRGPTPRPSSPANSNILLFTPSLYIHPTQSYGECNSPISTVTRSSNSASPLSLYSPASTSAGGSPRAIMSLARNYPYPDLRSELYDASFLAANDERVATALDPFTAPQLPFYPYDGFLTPNSPANMSSPPSSLQTTGELLYEGWRAVHGQYGGHAYAPSAHLATPGWGTEASIDPNHDLALAPSPHPHPINTTYVGPGNTYPPYPELSPLLLQSTGFGSYDQQSIAHNVLHPGYPQSHLAPSVISHNDLQLMGIAAPYPMYTHDDHTLMQPMEAQHQGNCPSPISRNSSLDSGSSSQ